MKISVSPDFKVFKAPTWKPGVDPELDRLVWRYKAIGKENNWEQNGASLACVALSEWGEIHFGTPYEAMKRLVEIAECNNDYDAVHSVYLKLAKATKEQQK